MELFKIIGFEKVTTVQKTALMHVKDPLSLSQESIWRSNDDESANNHSSKKEHSKTG
jgi:hypothetical protein